MKPTKYVVPCPPQISCLFPYDFLWDRFFLATLVCLHEALVYCVCCSLFHLLAITKVGHGVVHRPYPIFSMIVYFLPIFLHVFLLTSSTRRRYETQPKA